jgi:predicted transcriptional regulator
VVLFHDVKQRTRSTVDALILSAALHSDFGVTKARLARELVLTYRKVNEHCEGLIEKRLLEYNPVTRTYHTTPLGRKIVELTEELAVHYRPVSNVLTKYKSRLEVGRIQTRERSRRIMKETIVQGKAKLNLFSVGPLLVLEPSFIHLEHHLINALVC